MRSKKLSKMVLTALSLTLLAGCAGGSSEAKTESTENAATAVNESTEGTTEAETEPEKKDPVITAGQVAMGGGGFVTGLISTSESGLYYARTDVGGAYRWDKDEARWVCLSYDITEKDRGLLGVDGLAVDPTDPSKVYMVCGTSYFSGGKTCIFVSNDYGQTFERVDVSDMIKNHGNGMGRQNGERIAVDPNKPDIILAGGRTGGIIKSEDGGKTWNTISFPVTSTANANGVCAICFDGTQKSSDGSTSRIYAAVSDKGNNLYVSEDGGKTWNTVAGLPDNYMPQRIKFNSNNELLITYSGAEGPWNGNGGAIWKLNPENGETTDISPAKESFGDVISDPANPDRMVASTINIWSLQPNDTYGDKYYVTLDGGQTWDDILDNMTMDANGVDWISECAIHWSGSLMIDPVENGKIMVTSGNGIFACDDIWASEPAFYFNAIGLEETVPLDAVSIKDGPLLTAIGDYDGFVHKDIFAYPERHKESVGTNHTIAAAGQAKDIWVRAGGDDKSQQLFYTLDAGKNWIKITNRPDGKACYGGKLALTADGKTIIWAPENAAATYYTEDYGETWKTCEGIASRLYLFADTVDSKYVYAIGQSCLYVSKDGGKTFEKKNNNLGDNVKGAAVPGKSGQLYLGANMNGVLYSDDFGETTKAVPNVIACSFVSTGKGLSEDCPALYIWGSVKGGDGLGVYMSLDAGETWVKLNKAEQEFGGPGNGQFIVGDQNVVGRCYMSTVGLGLVYFQYEE